MIITQEEINREAVDSCVFEQGIFNPELTPYYEQGFKDGIGWFKKSLFHKTKDEVPQLIGDYANEVYPQIPCLVKGQLSTGYGYGVRYWNVKCQVWDDEECDDYECDKKAVEEWAYLDDIIGNMED